MQAPAKVCDENERKKQEKRHVRKNINVIDRRKPFITPISKTGENNLHASFR